MLDIEYKIMVFVKDHPDCTKIDVINEFDPHTACMFISGLVQSMCDNGYFTIKGRPSDEQSTLRLAPEAFRLIAWHEQEIKDKDSQDRNRNHEKRKDRIFGIFCTFVGALLTWITSLITSALT